MWLIDQDIRIGWSLARRLHIDHGEFAEDVAKRTDEGVSSSTNGDLLAMIPHARSLAAVPWQRHNEVGALPVAIQSVGS